MFAGMNCKTCANCSVRRFCANFPYRVGNLIGLFHCGSPIVELCNAYLSHFARAVFWYYSGVLAKPLTFILRLFQWKHSVFAFNANRTAAFFELHSGQVPCYSKTVQAMANDLEEFIEARSSYLHASSAKSSGATSEPLKLEIDPFSLAILSEMQKGGLLLTAHYGNYESMGLWLRRLGIPLIASYLPQRPRFLNHLLLRLRSVDGNPYAQILPPRAIVRKIRSGSLFCLLADQDYRSARPILSTFLGCKVQCNPLPVFLLNNIPGLPVYCSYIHHLQNHRILTVVKLNLASPSDLYFEYHRWLETLIGHEPNRWYGWFHRRFYSTSPSQ